MTYSHALRIADMKGQRVGAASLQRQSRPRMLPKSLRIHSPEEAAIGLARKSQVG